MSLIMYVMVIGAAQRYYDYCDYWYYDYCVVKDRKLMRLCRNMGISDAVEWEVSVVPELKICLSFFVWNQGSWDSIVIIYVFLLVNLGFHLCLVIYVIGDICFSCLECPSII